MPTFEVWENQIMSTRQRAWTTVVTAFVLDASTVAVFAAAAGERVLSGYTGLALGRNFSRI